MRNIKMDSIIEEMGDDSTDDIEHIVININGIEDGIKDYTK